MKSALNFRKIVITVLIAVLAILFSFFLRRIEAGNNILFYDEYNYCPTSDPLECPLGTTRINYGRDGGDVGQTEYSCHSKQNNFCLRLTGNANTVFSNYTVDPTTRIIGFSRHCQKSVGGCSNGRLAIPANIKDELIKFKSSTDTTIDDLINNGLVCEDVEGDLLVRIPEFDNIDNYSSVDKLQGAVEAGYGIRRWVYSTDIFCSTKDSVYLDDFQGDSVCVDNINQTSKIRPCAIDYKDTEICISGTKGTPGQMVGIQDARIGAVPLNNVAYGGSICCKTPGQPSSRISSAVSDNDLIDCKEISIQPDEFYSNNEGFLGEFDGLIVVKSLPIDSSNISDEGYFFLEKTFIEHPLPSTDFILCRVGQPLSGFISYPDTKCINPYRIRLDSSGNQEFLPSPVSSSQIESQLNILDEKLCKKTGPEIMYAYSNKGCSEYAKVTFDGTNINIDLEKEDFETCVDCIYGGTKTIRNKLTDSGNIETDLCAKYGFGNDCPADGSDIDYNTEPFAEPIPGRVYTEVGGCVDTSNPSSIVNTFMRIALGIMGAVVILRIIQGALTLQKGDDESIEEGKDIIVSALIGLLVIILSTAILNFIGINILQIDGFTPFG